MIPTDRELMLQAQEEAEAQRYAVEMIDQWRAQGMGAAAFALAMLDALAGDDTGLTRAETLALVAAALRGR